jgi:acetolactate synthase regulatory subunit
MAKELNARAGQHIGDFAAELVQAAKEHGSARGKHNDIEIVADATSTPESLVAQWQKKMDDAHVAYINSPEGIAAAAEREARIVAHQERHDDLVRDLSSIDFKDDVAVLDWLCAIQESTDHVGVMVAKQRIITAFHVAGFVANANCGAAFDGEDRDNYFRWIVGQALDGIESVAIHGVIHKFTGDWKLKFCARAA